MQDQGKLLTLTIVASSVAGGLLLFFGLGTTHDSTSKQETPPTRTSFASPLGNTPQPPFSPRVRNQHDTETTSNLRSQIINLIQSEGSWLGKLNSLSEQCELLVGEIGIEAALLAAHEDAGPGKIRNWMITAMIGASTANLGDVIQLVQALEGDAEIKAGLDGVVTMIRRSVPNPDDYRNLTLSQPEIDAIAAGLAMKIGTTTKGQAPFNIHQAFTLLETAHGNNSVSDRVIAQFLDHVSQTRPLEALELGLSKLDSGSLSGMETVARNSIRTAPTKTISILKNRMTSDPHASAKNLFKIGIAEWLGVDFNAATQWIDAKDAELSSSQKDVINGVLVQHSVKGDKLEEAWKRVAEINDPELRKKTEGDVWSAERNAIRRETTNNPSETIRSLVSGESKHADYWIEEAMMTWISNEPDKAEEWYQKNWKSLPPAKSQYIAAAYAKEALEAGDIATARQWTNLIQDPKTKDRIATSIDKAQSTQGQ